MQYQPLIKLSVGLFKPLLLKDWVTIQDQLPKLKAKYEKLIERNIIQFIDGVVSVSQSDDIHAAVHDAVKLSRQNMLRKALVLRNRSSVIFGKIESACRVAHRLILDEVGSSWADTFALCGDEKGKKQTVMSQKFLLTILFRQGSFST